MPAGAASTTHATHTRTPSEAIGEIVSTSGAAGFEGYWRNEEAEHARVRATVGTGPGTSATATRPASSTSQGAPTTGCASTARTSRQRPSPACIERHPDVVLAAVYAVPDPVTGDQVMAALQLREGAAFDPDAFAAFLAAQPDLGTKWAPRYVRICGSSRPPPPPRS